MNVPWPVLIVALAAAALMFLASVGERAVDGARQDHREAAAAVDRGDQARDGGRKR